MMRRLNYLSLILIAVFSISFMLPDRNIRIWLAGDSTLCEYPRSRYPLTGWGMPFADFFDSTATVENKARGGRSTRTFISEGRWKEITDNLHAGDFVLIQFGHNDEVKEKTDRYTPVADYKTNLTRFINDTKKAQATPILITPVTRMRFDSLGNVPETHKDYSAAMREVAKLTQVSLIDLDSLSRQLLQRYGPERSKDLYMYLDSLQHPFYPAGQKDGTHFNEFGARRMAELVLSEIRRQHLPLESRITRNTAK
ncbi:rhamnogalacturonan acetylesterase [Terrimonas ferruginea]|uniref:rhamnogalacturonan acetylesterase n=1 Tax=Terrimonas ferruginea TaxID=249 RepID=UPI0003FA00B1|nr:rhamnogalacturonan acetylesterase [Terrimonas ferruginea]